MSKVRVRFAPSPTGPLHIGGARSALFNYLYAAQNNGDFIMRMEDTDLKRSTKESEENIKESLKWLGINWNEGIDIGGPYEPYRQTERLDTYKEAAEQLIKDGHAYYCYCSNEELEAERKAALAKEEMPIYSGKCRNLTDAEKAEKEAAGIKPVLRFKVDDGDPIHIKDLVRGDVYFERGGVGDFVIVKSDGLPVYNFAVIVDDYIMKISHVLRGEEHLSNTPRQVVLYEALGWEMPKFGHVSLILGKDRSKMSKRHGSVSVESYYERGFLPEAIVNFLALLGWSPEGREEMFRMEDLIEQFSLKRVSKSPAVFDIEKLRWLNGQYIKEMKVGELAIALRPYLEDTEFKEDYMRLELLAETVQNHILTLPEVRDYLPLILGDDKIKPEDEKAAAKLEEDTVPKVLDLFAEKITSAKELDPDTVQTILKEILKETELKGGKVYMPIRIAISGSMHGPDIDKLVSLIGKERLEKRLQGTINSLKNK